MTHRYERYAVAVGIESSLKELRHYSATQLLTNGVDLSTVAGRLGHADGSTTLRFYAQFVRPADQHAATLLSDRLSDLRKKEQLRKLFAADGVPGGGADSPDGLHAPSVPRGHEGEERHRPSPKAHLAHGDLDVTHIWLDRHGRYTGIIDFGELRGADPFFDVGHFLLHDRETRPQPLFEEFLAGYAEAAPLPDEHRDQIRRSAILSGLRQLSLRHESGNGIDSYQTRAKYSIKCLVCG